MEVCGHQGIALSGHKDDSTQLEDMDSNPGIFHALLKFRCNAGDAALKQHFCKCARNATYDSGTTQNEIIDVLGGMITETVIAELNEATANSFLSYVMKFKMQLQQSKSRVC